VKEQDKAGNQRTQDFTFLYDAAPAIATVTFPADGSFHTGAITLSGGSFDNAGPGGFASNVSTVAVLIQSLTGATAGKCFVEGSGFTGVCSGGFGPFFIPAFGAPANWTFTPSPNSFVTGQKYLVVAQGTDSAGNAQAAFAQGASSNTFTF